MLLKRGSAGVHCDWIGPRDGPVVCLLHGLMADAGMWSEQVTALAQAGFGVLRIDLPGHGGSSVNDDCTLDGLSLWVEDTLAALEVRSTHLVGLSLGGIVAQSIAWRDRVKLQSLTLCATLVSAPDDPSQAWRQRVADVLAGKADFDQVARGALGRWLTPSFRDRFPRRWLELHETAAAVAPQAYAACVELVNTFDLRERIAAIACPTLVMCGADDPASPPALAERIASTIPGARWIGIDGALHLPNIEKPQAFNQALLEWLEHNRH